VGRLGECRPLTLRPRLATAALSADPAFAPWVDRIGTVRIPRRSESFFAYLVRAICYQQLAGAAARSIHARVLEELGGEATPDAVLAATPAALRTAGLSRAKEAAVRELASAVRGGLTPLGDLDSVSSEDIVTRLTTVRGVGPWTVHMLLIFRMRRADVWPTGDLAVRRGYARIHGMTETPAARELERLGERLRPWRSAAAWYCYRALEIEAP